MLSGPRDLVFLIFCIATFTFSYDTFSMSAILYSIFFSSSSSWFSCVRLLFGFSSLWKCSSHLSKISGLLLNVFPYMSLHMLDLGLRPFCKLFTDLYASHIFFRVKFDANTRTTFFSCFDTLLRHFLFVVVGFLSLVSCWHSLSNHPFFFESSLYGRCCFSCCAFAFFSSFLCARWIWSWKMKFNSFLESYSCVGIFRRVYVELFGCSRLHFYCVWYSGSQFF